MRNDIQKYFEPNEGAFYETNNGDKRCRSIHNKYDNTRINKAIEQSNLPPVPISKVISYVNELLELIKLKNGIKSKTVQVKTIELDKVNQFIIDNGIITINCNWDLPVYDENKKEYTYWDSKYDIIKKEFNLKYPNDIVWIKFTTDGHVGVVAKSFDINFDYTTTSGKLVKKVNHEWNTSFVLLFPLTHDILNQYTKESIETAIGNYLIEKKVPIIDFYSHNY